MAPHSSTLAWKITWMEEPGRLQSMGSLRVICQIGSGWLNIVLSNKLMSRCLIPILEMRTLKSIGVWLLVQKLCNGSKDKIPIMWSVLKLTCLTIMPTSSQCSWLEARLERRDRTRLYWEARIWWCHDREFGFCHLGKRQPLIISAQRSDTVKAMLLRSQLYRSGNIISHLLMICFT